ncbi:MAG: retropepsin-like aspartic protease [Mariprofundaceae bacterium]|nr:retropepsin-like aspartic protease [Mariprofundaceae bacterium]
MPSIILALFACLLVMPVHAGSLSTVTNPAFNLGKGRAQVPYRTVGNAMMVEGRVNGVAVRFIVDTGASFVVIPPVVARRAGIETAQASRVSVQTANGLVQAPLVNISRLEIGRLSQRQVSAVVQRISPDGQTGLLGMSFLSAYQMTVDQSHSMLLLEVR